MARTSDIAKVERVNRVRKVRLDRLAARARAHADDARAAADDAAAREAARMAALDAARAHVHASPGCDQLRLWHQVCATRRTEATTARDICEIAAVNAQAALASRIVDVRNHDLRSSRITDFGRSVRRGELRVAEMRAEDEALPSRVAGPSDGG